jgi:hypothetical protein
VTMMVMWTVPPLQHCRDHCSMANVGFHAPTAPPIYLALHEGGA